MSGTSTIPIPASYPPSVPCRVCGAAAVRFTVVDFAKACSEEPWTHHVPVGAPVLYYRCPLCKLAFTTFFDEWSPQDFRTHVYNDRYIEVDGDYLETRPRNMANSIAHSFPDRSIRILDYGGGNGKTAELLRGHGFTDVTVYDPFNPDFAVRPGGTFDFILAIEVFEHNPNPVQMGTDLAVMLKTDGLIFLTTWLQPPEFDQIKGEHWYLAPRNGHIAFHSAQSLTSVFSRQGLKVGHLPNPGSHVIFRQIPKWAAHLFQNVPPR